MWVQFPAVTKGDYPINGFSSLVTDQEQMEPEGIRDQQSIIGSDRPSVEEKTIGTQHPVEGGDYEPAGTPGE